MLELAHKLADSDTKFFGGWVLAGVEAHIHGQAVKLENRMLLEKERKCIIQVRGTTLADSVERLVKELRVFLVLPKNKLGTKTIEPETPTGKLLVEHVFTVQEVRDYVAYTGDENIIHQGEHPIVPGLCMAPAGFAKARAGLAHQLSRSGLHRGRAKGLCYRAGAGGLCGHY